MSEYIFERSLTDDETVVAAASDAVGAKLKLGCAFLAGDVKDSLRLDRKKVLENETADLG